MKESIRLEILKDIRKIEDKYSINYKDILKIIDTDINVPLSIFNKELGSLESIVKYLKEDLNLTFKEISFLINRKVQSVRTTYNRTIKKHPQSLKIKSKDKIPLNILKKTEFSVLENLVSYLLKNNFTINEISSLLNRNYQTIWTINNRFIQKT